MSKARKIAIIGNAGSGKTTLALQLKEKLNLPLYHLDQYYWLPNWQRIGIEKFTEIHHALCKQEAWIIEGPYSKTLEYRFLHADVIIFLDFPRSTCLLRVLKRSIVNYNKVVIGNPKDCKQQLFSFKFLHFLKWVWNFDKKYKAMISHLLDRHKNEKQIHILKSSEQIHTLLEKIKS